MGLPVPITMHSPLSSSSCTKHYGFSHSIRNSDLGQRMQQSHYWQGRGRGRGMFARPGPLTITSHRAPKTGTLAPPLQGSSSRELPQGSGHLLSLSCPSCQKVPVPPSSASAPGQDPSPAQWGAQLPTKE